MERGTAPRSPHTHSPSRLFLTLWTPRPPTLPRRRSPWTRTAPSRRGRRPSRGVAGSLGPKFCTSRGRRGQLMRRGGRRRRWASRRRRPGVWVCRCEEVRGGGRAEWRCPLDGGGHGGSCMGWSARALSSNASLPSHCLPRSPGGLLERTRLMAVPIVAAWIWGCESEVRFLMGK